LDTCLNETIRLTIPPHLAFDDGRKNFARKPVPPKSTVIYEIKVVDVSLRRCGRHGVTSEGRAGGSA
jgi:hypothetical protein